MFSIPRAVCTVGGTKHWSCYGEIALSIPISDMHRVNKLMFSFFKTSTSTTLVIILVRLKSEFFLQNTVSAALKNIHN